MTIAVHINISSPANDPIQNFNYHCFSLLATKYPDDHFIFISDKPLDPNAITAGNITPVVLTPLIRNSLLLHFWYNFKLPRLLNKYHTDLFVSNGTVCSSRTDIPQYMIVHDLPFPEKKQPGIKNESRYLKKYFRQFTAKAKRIIFTNAAVRDLVVKKDPALNNKTDIVSFGLTDIFAPAGSTIQENTKQQFSEGRDYFLFFATPVSRSNIIPLLKAFSIFKKWQKSSMQLVLLFGAAEKDSEIKDLATYKYRNEVRIIYTDTAETIASLTAAAYAAVYLPASAQTEWIGMAALKTGIPLLTSDTAFCKSVYRDAALYTGTHEKNIAEQMMMVYKDEQLRNSLISKGKLVSADYTPENTADQLWPVLMDSVEA